MRHLTLAALFALVVPAVASAQPADKPRVKLVVLVVFDQMRGDYLEKWKPLFGKGGFNRLQDEGAWFANCHYPYGTTTTGPGHASILTGTCADKHGIINNDWYEKGRGVYCAGDDRYQLVPAPYVKPGTKPRQLGTPERLLVDTVADVLKRERGAKAKVFGLSLKDRSAILPTGKRPDGAFWFDGRFVTSTYYPDARIPQWLEEYTASGASAKWFGKSWDKLRPDLDYAKYSGPDDVPGEGRRSTVKDDETPPFGRTFPHPIGYAETKPGPKYREGVAFSPFGNDVVLDVAKRCIVAEELGRDDVPDLLTVSFSSNDLIGHTWGPDSQEVLDVTLRSDLLMADFLGFLDEKVGAGNYAVALTADHGVCPLPEVSAAKGLDAKRIDPKPFHAGIEKHLQAKFGSLLPPKTDDKSAQPAWFEAVYAPWMYVNPRLAKLIGKSPAEVARAAAEYLEKQPEVFRVFTRDDLARDFPESDPLGRRVKRSFHPERSGDVYVVLKPYYLLSSPLSTGTTHGAPHAYDTHVPLLVYGPGVKGGRREEATTPQATAAIFARFLGVKPPATADFPIPATLDAK